MSRVDWPRDQLGVESLGRTFRKMLLGQGKDIDFCKIAFSKLRFIAVDTDKQSLHVLWALKVTKQGYTDISVSDSIRHDVTSTGP